MLSHVKLDAQHTEHISTIAEKGHCYLKTTKIRYYIRTYLISLLYEKALFEKTPFIAAIFVTVFVREESEIISNVGVGTVRQSPVELDKVVDHMAYLSVTVCQAITQVILKITIVIVISLVYQFWRDLYSIILLLLMTPVSKGLLPALNRFALDYTIDSGFNDVTLQTS